MAVSNYKVWGVGPPVGNGVTQSLHIGVAGIAKSNLPGPPTTVANELVCNRLANALLLPIPPGFVIQHNGTPHFVSLNFNVSGNSLPPANCNALATAQPELCWGIVLFDIWVLNDDRHPLNIAFDTTTGAVQIFDHSHALFAKGVAQLPALATQLGIGGQCIAAHLQSLNGLDDWCNRIESLPERYIRTVVMDIADPQFNVTPVDATVFADWIIDRRSRLKPLVLAHQARFPNVLPAAWAAALPAAAAQAPAAPAQQGAAP